MGLSLDQQSEAVRAAKAEARTYDRELDVFTVGVITCRPTRKEAEDYYNYSVAENADWTSVDEILAAKHITADRVPADQFQTLRRQQANGMGGLPLVGDPDDVAAQLAQLANAGLRGIGVSTNSPTFAPRSCPGLSGRDCVLVPEARGSSALRAQRRDVLRVGRLGYRLQVGIDIGQVVIRQNLGAVPRHLTGRGSHEVCERVERQGIGREFETGSPALPHVPVALETADPNVCLLAPGGVGRERGAAAQTGHGSTTGEGELQDDKALHRTASARRRYDVDQHRLAGLHDLDGALERRAQIFWVLDRTNAEHAHRLCELGVVDERILDCGADA
jgi:hypothetical protein